MSSAILWGRWSKNDLFYNYREEGMRDPEERGQLVHNDQAQ